VYRVLDMDDGVTVHTHTDVLRAAADGDWEKVHDLAESITYGLIQRQFKVSLSPCASCQVPLLDRKYFLSRRGVP